MFVPPNSQCAEEWGGKTPMVAISAKKGQGVDDLLETVSGGVRRWLCCWACSYGRLFRVDACYQGRENEERDL